MAQLRGWDDTVALAIVFGLASVPWTYAFIAGLQLPLWPSFIASATFYAAGGGIEGLKKSYASTFSGILYAAATLWIVTTVFSGDILALSITVGVFMFLASLHDYVPVLSFTPGAFFGYATTFSVDAAPNVWAGPEGLWGTILVTFASMLLGAAIGISTEAASKSIG